MYSFYRPADWHIAACEEIDLDALAAAGSVRLINGYT